MSFNAIFLPTCLADGRLIVCEMLANRKLWAFEYSFLIYDKFSGRADGSCRRLLIVCGIIASSALWAFEQ